MPPSMKELKSVASKMTGAGLDKLPTTIASLRMVTAIGFHFGAYNRFNRFANLQELNCRGSNSQSVTRDFFLNLPLTFTKGGSLSWTEKERRR